VVYISSLIASENEPAPEAPIISITEGTSIRIKNAVIYQILNQTVIAS